jgi:hypothetical protein
MVEIGDIHLMFPESTVVVERNNPVVDSDLLGVIGRADHALLDQMLIEAGFDLDLVVDLDGWDDRCVTDEIGHVLWVCDDVVSPLEWGRLQVYGDRWFTMKTPSLDTIRAHKLRRQVDGWLEVWFGLTVNPNPMWELGKSCVQCDGPFYGYDRRGLGWCRQHYS